MPLKILNHIPGPAKQQSRRKEIGAKISGLVTESSLEWYRLTESSRNVLNSLITFAAKEKLKELKKQDPNQDRAKSLEVIYAEAHSVSLDGSRFESLESMKAIIKHYQAVFEDLKKAR